MPPVYHNPTDWPAHLLASGEVWDIGQLGAADRRALDRMVRAGKASKDRAIWPYRTHGTAQKTVWTRRNPRRSSAAALAVAAALGFPLGARVRGKDRRYDITYDNRVTGAHWLGQGDDRVLGIELDGAGTWPAQYLPTVRRNPVERRPDGYYALLPRHFRLRGPSTWWIGPYRREVDAEIAAGAVRAGPLSDVGVFHGKDGYFVRVAGGLRKSGAPVIGPFARAATAAATAGRVKPAGWQPLLAEVTDLVPDKPAMGEAHRPARAPVRPPPAASGPRPPDPEAVGTLVSLGTSKREAQAMVEQAQARLGPSAGSETIIREVFRMQRASNPRPVSEPCPACGRRVRVKRAAAFDCRWCGARLGVR